MQVSILMVSVLPGKNQNTFRKAPGVTARSFHRYGGRFPLPIAVIRLEYICYTKKGFGFSFRLLGMNDNRFE